MIEYDNQVRSQGTYSSQLSTRIQSSLFQAPGR